MASDLISCQLGQLVDNYDSIRVPVKKSDRQPGPYPYYGASGVVDHVDGHLFDGEYLLVAEDGENLRTRKLPIAFIASGKFWVNNHAHVIRANESADTRYLMYALSEIDMSGYISGSTRPKLTKASLNQIRLSVPCIAQQRRIARVLGSLDEKIQLNRDVSRMLEETARAIFRSWFIDFDPVRSKMEGREPGLPSSLSELFPNRLVDSQLGEIPAEWMPISLTNAMEVNPRRQLRRTEIAPYLEMANMPTQGHRPSRVGHKPFGSGTRFMNGDTLVARITPCLENGKTAFVDFLQDSETGWGSTEYIVLRPKPPLVESFAYFLARTNEFREFAVGAMTGSSGRQRIPVQALSDFHFPMPPVNIAQAFSKIVAPLIRRSSIATEDSTILTNLRDSLLPHLVSGSHQAPLATE